MASRSNSLDLLCSDSRQAVIIDAPHYSGVLGFGVDSLFPAVASRPFSAAGDDALRAVMDRL